MFGLQASQTVVREHGCRIWSFDKSYIFQIIVSRGTQKAYNYKGLMCKDYRLQLTNQSRPVVSCVICVRET